MSLIRLVAVVLVGLTAAAFRATAQIPASGDLLTLPQDGLVICRSLMPSVTDSVTYRLEWQFGNGREIKVTYDSSGSPVRMDVVALEESDTAASRMLGLTVRFGPAGTTIGARGIMGAGAHLLTDAEIARARELAATLWSRRCGTGSPRHSP